MATPRLLVFDSLKVRAALLLDDRSLLRTKVVRKTRPTTSLELKARPCWFIMTYNTFLLAVFPT